MKKGIFPSWTFITLSNGNAPYFVILPCLINQSDSRFMFSDTFAFDFLATATCISGCFSILSSCFLLFCFTAL